MTNAWAAYFVPVQYVVLAKTTRQNVHTSDETDYYTTSFSKIPRDLRGRLNVRNPDLFRLPRRRLRVTPRVVRQTAFYFAWMNFYFRWLLVPGIAGLLVTVHKARRE